MMPVDQADGIEGLMEKGYTRVQAIKIFYEQSLAKYYKKQYNTEGAGYDQTGLVKSNVERFNALEQSHLSEKPINYLGRRFSKPGDPGHYDEGHGEPEKQPPTRTIIPNHLDGDRSPSPLSLDSCFKTMPQVVEVPNETPNDIIQPLPIRVPSQDPSVSLRTRSQEHVAPTQTRSQDPLVASSEEKQTLEQQHQPQPSKAVDDIFPTIEFENEVQYTEEEDSLCGADPTISNVAKFLSSCDFTTEEKQEFFFLLSQGLNIDEASDRIYHKRLEQSMDIVPPELAKEGKMNKEVLLTTVRDNAQSNRPRYPLRLHGFSGDREEDLFMLSERGYTSDQAHFLCDFIYEAGNDFFRRILHIAPVILGDKAPYANHLNDLGLAITKSSDKGAFHNGEGHGITIKVVRSKSHSNEEDELFIPDADSVNADTLIQLKRLKTFARGGFKSNFSIENNCAFSEHEALKLGLIVSQQEADYGINMYDALMPSDEQQIEKLIRTGCTLDEAILKVFESRFGKTKLDTSALDGNTNNGPSILKDHHHENENEAAEKLESEISLLMLSGYTREKAVKILLERKKKEQQEQQHHSRTSSRPPSEAGSTSSLNSAGVAYPSLNNLNTNSSPSPQKRLIREPSQERIEREALMSQLPPSAQRKTGVASSASKDRTDGISSPGLQRSTSTTETALSAGSPQRYNSEYEAMIRHQLSMDPYSSARGGIPVIPPIDTRRGGVAPATPAYDSSVYGAPNVRTPTQYRNSPSSNNVYGSPADYQHPPLPPAPYPTPNHPIMPQQQPIGNIYRNEEYRILRDIPSDEKAFRIGILISQQEAAFGTNMYQSIHTADASEMTQLIARGYNEDESALYLFERKFGRTPAVPETMYVPQQQRNSNNNSLAHSPAAANHYLPPHHSPAHVAEPAGPGVVRVPGINSGNSSGLPRSPMGSRVPSNNNMPRVGSAVGGSAAGGGSGTNSANRSYNNSPTIIVNNAFPAPGSSNSPTPTRVPSSYGNPAASSPASGARRSNNTGGAAAPAPLTSQPSQNNMRRVPSMHQQTTPPPVGMMNPSDISDIHPNDLHTLIGMGFSQFQAIQALRLKNYNVQLAAEYLLEN